MKLVSLFNGEQSRSVDVGTRAEVIDASRSMALGQGWGQRLCGTEAELRSVDAWRSSGAYDPAQWLFDGRAEGGHLIFAEMALGPAADIGAAARCVPLSDPDEPGHIPCRVDCTRCDADAAAPEQQC